MTRPSGENWACRASICPCTKGNGLRSPKSGKIHNRCGAAEVSYIRYCPSGESGSDRHELLSPDPVNRKGAVDKVGEILLPNVPQFSAATENGKVN